jgi:DNA repair photolyase
VLTASSLPSLAPIPTINLAAGRTRECAYCHSKGYSNHPGDNAIFIYRDTAERVANELKRKPIKAGRVCFCPSSDALQPVRAVLDESCRTMRVLLEAGVGVEFVTRGTVPGR